MSKRSMRWGLPLSRIVKSSLRRSATGPFLSRTTTLTSTSCVLTRIVPSCTAWPAAIMDVAARMINVAMSRVRIISALAVLFRRLDFIIRFDFETPEAFIGVGDSAGQAKHLRSFRFGEFVEEGSNDRFRDQNVEGTRLILDDVADQYDFAGDLLIRNHRVVFPPAHPAVRGIHPDAAGVPRVWCFEFRQDSA